MLWTFARNEWDAVLTSSLVGRFESLQGVHILLRIFMDERDASALKSTDIMHHKVWNAVKIPMILRSFQQHKLMSSLTAVNIEAIEAGNFSRSPLSPSQIRPVEDAVRAALLDHHPRRLSKRNKNRR